MLDNRRWPYNRAETCTSPPAVEHAIIRSAARLLVFAGEVVFSFNPYLTMYVTRAGCWCPASPGSGRGRHSSLFSLQSLLLSLQPVPRGPRPCRGFLSLHPTPLLMALCQPPASPTPINSVPWRPFQFLICLQIHNYPITLDRDSSRLSAVKDNSRAPSILRHAYRRLPRSWL